MVQLLRHRQTKGAATDRLHLRPPRHISTLPFPAVQPITKDYTFYLWLVPEYEGPQLLRVVRRLPVEYLRTLTGLRLGAGVLQPLTEPVIPRNRKPR